MIICSESYYLVVFGRIQSAPTVNHVIVTSVILLPPLLSILIQYPANAQTYLDIIFFIQIGK